MSLADMGDGPTDGGTVPDQDGGDALGLVTVAICTWNRARLLEETLRSFEGLLTPRGFRYELLIVDNGSTDSTVEVVRRFEGRLPIRLVTESRLGLSHARNAAIDAAAGELLVWTDDDVRVDANWLNAYWRASLAMPGTSLWGGTIRPLFESDPPAWIHENWATLSGIFAVREWEEAPPMDAEHPPFGANLAIRTEVQRLFRYNTDYGRQGQSLKGYEEVDVLQRIAEAGHRGAWVIEAIVDHVLPAERLTLDYVGRYFEGQGVTWAARGKWLGSAGELRRRYVWNLVWFALKRWTSASGSWLACWIEAARCRGQLSVLRDQRRA